MSRRVLLAGSLLPSPPDSCFWFAHNSLPLPSRSGWRSHWPVFKMAAGIHVSLPIGADAAGCMALLSAEWRRLGIEDVVETRPENSSMRLRLTEQRAQEWMPGHDTLLLAGKLKLDVSRNENDLLREIWLTLLNTPVMLEFPSADELLAAVRMRRNIVANASRTCLNFDLEAIERPQDCWRYSQETGFVLIPGSPLISSLKKPASRRWAGCGILFLATGLPSMSCCCRSPRRRWPAIPRCWTRCSANGRRRPSPPTRFRTSSFTSKARWRSPCPCIIMCQETGSGFAIPTPTPQTCPALRDRGCFIWEAACLPTSGKASGPSAC